MNTHHIGVREAASIGIIFIIAKIFLPFQRSLAESGGTAGWIIALIAALLCPLTWWAIRGVLRHASGGSTLIEATEEIWGPWLGTAWNLVYFSFFFAITFLVLREFSELLASDILPRTPMNIIMIAMLIPIAVVAYAGLEGIGRFCWSAAGLIVASVVVVLLGGLMTHFEPNALQPFWGTGRTRVLSLGLVKSSLFSEMLVFGFLLPRLRKKGQWGKAAWWCMGVSAFTIFITTFVYLFVFPYPTAVRLNVPMFELSRLVIFGRWIQRLESVFLIAWLICAVMKLAIGLYCSAATLSQVMKLPKIQPVIFPLALLVYACSIIPGSEMEAVSWDGQFLRTYGSLVSIGIPMLTWLLGMIRTKLKGRQA
ncbi:MULTISPECIES: GerAB/ArcD/ProY family transporter [unclassified Paenibacillus]|uniref:GerAB/ArcD/ProY family transporter n=1 Tax=unclassified Paenibacillus TaxID=185978 RepID=UPI0009566EB2|nr:MULTISPECIES: GerAB/ArcD/ProY family transporter [unclassified Paenibacillus]ASS65611.1 GerAB/ArcD/ProY family transporter [Paenibacillus sp. RUD330]SIQ29853.1 spore germination protein (amino acid permease) [Paenibacillus sp. RU4X]SIQ51831.1 spore germination protein (amino acid permease) [Paenibacillus sp. RU4T]